MGALAKAVKSNDRRKTLVALRNKIAATIDDTDSGRDIAALSKRLIEVEAELDALSDPNASSNPVQAAKDNASRRKRGG